MDAVGDKFTLSAGISPFARLVLPHARKLMILALMLADLLGLFAAGAAAVGVRHLLLGPLPDRFYTWILPLAGVLVFVYYVRGLYPAIGLGAVEEFHNLTVTTSVFFLIASALVYLSQAEASFSRMVFALLWTFSLACIPAARIIVRHLFTCAGLWGEPVAIIGRPQAAKKLAAYFRAFPKIGLCPRVVYVTEPDNANLIRGLPVIAAEHISPQVGGVPLYTALVAYEEMDEFKPIREAYRDLFERVILVSVRDGGIELGGVSVRQYGSLLSFEIRDTLLDRSAQRIKRTIDLILAGLGTLALAPLLGLTALVIKLDSPGGVFYRQKRLGKNGRVFDLLKFRTMHVDADAVLKAYLAQNPAMQKEWDCYQKLKDDPRITGVGRILRRFSIDELPQLWNVLTGDMSLVGPRPIMLNQQEMYGSNLKQYIRVVPGMTGQWQISGRNHTSFAQRTEFDLQYVMNWSVWLDIYILVRTVWVVLKRDGAC